MDRQISENLSQITVLILQYMDWNMGKLMVDQIVLSFNKNYKLYICFLYTVNISFKKVEHHNDFIVSLLFIYRCRLWLGLQGIPKTCPPAHLSTLWKKYNRYHNYKMWFTNMDIWHCACRIATSGFKNSYRYAQPNLEVWFCFSTSLEDSTKSSLADFSCPVRNITPLFRVW